MSSESLEGERKSRPPPPRPPPPRQPYPPEADGPPPDPAQSQSQAAAGSSANVTRIALNWWTEVLSATHPSVIYDAEGQCVFCALGTRVFQKNKHAKFIEMDSLISTRLAFESARTLVDQVHERYDLEIKDVLPGRPEVTDDMIVRHYFKHYTPPAFLHSMAVRVHHEFALELLSKAKLRHVVTGEEVPDTKYFSAYIKSEERLGMLCKHSMSSSRGGGGSSSSSGMRPAGSGPARASSTLSMR